MSQLSVIGFQDVSKNYQAAGTERQPRGFDADENKLSIGVYLRPKNDTSRVPGGRLGKTGVV